MTNLSIVCCFLDSFSISISIALVYSTWNPLWLNPPPAEIKQCTHQRQQQEKKTHHQKCIFCFFVVLQLLQVFSYLGCLGQQGRIQQVNLHRPQSCIFDSLNAHPLLQSSNPSLFTSLSFMLRMFQWKTTLEWSLQVNVERGWRNRKEGSSRLPTTQTNTPQTQSVFTSLKVNILFRRGVAVRKKARRSGNLFTWSWSSPGVILEGGADEMYWRVRDSERLLQAAVFQIESWVVIDQRR